MCGCDTFCHTVFDTGFLVIKCATAVVEIVVANGCKHLEVGVFSAQLTDFVLEVSQ